MTHVGRVRKNNEDCVRVVDDLGLLIVADGMGGHSGGEIASALAAGSIIEYLRPRLTAATAPGEVEGLMAEAVERAGEAIRLRAAEDSRLQDMGTTLVLAICRGNQIHLGHMGDSRAYLVADGTLRRLTRDHSLVGEMIESGELTPRRARRHPLRNVITRSLGGRGVSKLDQQTLNWKAEDCLLLCSDGLTNMVEEDDLLKVILRAGGELGQACRMLVEKANAKGGRDNISVILAGQG
jgi:protein phosphatase